MKIASIAMAALAALICGVLIFNHVETATRLRTLNGMTQVPLMHPLLLAPAAGVAAAAWLLSARHNAAALAMSALSLAIATLFLLSQAAGRLGGP